MQVIKNDKNVFTFTKEGYQKLLDELNNLKKLRQEIAERLKEAASYGDLSENAAYTSAMEARDINESRIAELEEILSNAVVLEENENQSDGSVQMGSKVKIMNESTGDIMSFMVVGAGEVDIQNNKYSIDSPLVSCLVGKKAGDKVRVKLPMGEFVFKIISVTK